MIAIIRHSHTEYNIIGESGRFCGSSDPSISERGIEESKKIGRHLIDKNYKYIYTSPLKRAYQTAQIINSFLKLPLIIEDNFKEIDYGLWEGMTKSDIIKKYSSEYILFENESYLFTPPKGECPTKALERFINTIATIKDNSIIITHKTVSRLYLCELKGINLNDYRKFTDLKLGSITLLSNIKNPKILEINNINHLK